MISLSMFPTKLKINLYGDLLALSTQSRSSGYLSIIWTMKTPEWLEIAQKEIGISRYPKGSSNPRITEYHTNTNIEGYDDKVAWCSSFLNWVFLQSAYRGTESALSRSWLNWGKPLEKPCLGCVVILEREDPTGWQGHVGLCLKIENENIYLLGGNQLDEVREHYYPLSSVLAYRWPTPKFKNRFDT